MNSSSGHLGLGVFGTSVKLGSPSAFQEDLQVEHKNSGSAEPGTLGLWHSWLHFGACADGGGPVRSAREATCTGSLELLQQPGTLIQPNYTQQLFRSLSPWNQSQIFALLDC